MENEKKKEKGFLHIKLQQLKYFKFAQVNDFVKKKKKVAKKKKQKQNKNKTQHIFFKFQNIIFKVFSCFEIKTGYYHYLQMIELILLPGVAEWFLESETGTTEQKKRFLQNVTTITK